ncbi:MAG: hypothetical protein R3Y67_05130 [Eubacteriales bacterium]
MNKQGETLLLNRMERFGKRELCDYLVGCTVQEAKCVQNQLKSIERV